METVFRCCALLVIARKNRSNPSHQSYSNSHENLLSSSYARQKRRVCSFCKSNGESASVYTSHGKCDLSWERVCAAKASLRL